MRRHAAQQTFCAAYRVAELEAVHTRLVALVDALLAARTCGDGDVPRVVAALQNLYDVLTRDLIRDRNYLDSFFFFGTGKVSPLLLPSIPHFLTNLPFSLSFFARLLACLLAVLSLRKCMLFVLETMRRRIQKPKQKKEKKKQAL
jgi:hypothetical protein